jgi:nucleoside-diphosphate-sugar epimerase
MDKHPIPTVVLGASGYLGRKVLEKFDSLNLPTIPVDISGHIACDLTNIEDLRKLKLPPTFNLLHLASLLPGTRPSRLLSESSRKMTNNIVSVLNPLKMLFVSSTAVYQRRLQNSIYPNVQPWEVYGREKFLQEETLMHSFENLTIFRCGTLIDEDRRGGISKLLKRGFSGGTLLLPKSGQVHHPFVDTNDVVNNIGRWAVDSNKSLPTGIIDIVGQNPKMFSEIFKKFSENSTKIYPLPVKITELVGSDTFPLFGLSRWHIGALSYDISNFEHTSRQYSTQDIDRVWDKVAKTWLK